MRAVLLALLIGFTTPALAADWGRYDNSRFGYTIAVPPEFEDMGEAENGDGSVFRGGFGTQVLTVFGGNIVDTDFAGEVAQRMKWAEDSGWNLTYQAVTPSWASYSAKRSGRILYARMISLCGGAQFAMFELEYFDVDLAELNPVVDRLVPSLKGSGGGC